MPADKEQVRTILVVGTTGSGKSELIKRLGGRNIKTGKPPGTSAYLPSCTKTTETYGVDLFGGARYHFVDTMGMLDTDEQDEKGIDSLACLVDHIATVVGVIYVVSGRLTPAEAEACNFLFGKFFDDLHPSRILVLITKQVQWKSYDARVDKDYLKRQEGVPKRILDANFVAVDLHPAYGSDVIKKMTDRILQPTQSWTTYVELSEKAGIAMAYFTTKKRLQDLEEELKECKTDLAELTKEREELNDEMKALRREHAEAIKELDNNSKFCALLGGMGGGIGGYAVSAGAATGLAAVAVPAALAGGAYLLGRKLFSKKKDANK